MSDTPTKPGLLQWITQTVTGGRGSQSSGWFTPSAPMAPQAPPDMAGRRYDYQTGINTNITPRGEEEIGFPALRNLIKNSDLVRICMETRKDQMVGENWTIQTREGRAQADQSRIFAAIEFFECPDKEHDWDQWSRMLVGDMLEIDAATLYPRLTNGGQLYALEPLDGATIKPLVDDWGRRPIAPLSAYQQVLHGVPADNYTSDQLLYMPRNPVTWRVYGLSPVEQIIITINTLLRRNLHKLAYYTDGTVPDALCGVPENWTIERISEFQDYFDALLTDNLAQRRKTRFVPGGIAKGYIQTKTEVLKDEADEWFARLVCYCLSVPNQWAVKQVNRAQSETAGEQADDEGRIPTRKWLKSVVDRCLRGPMKSPDLEFIWQGKAQPDPLVVAQTNAIYLQHGVISLDRARADIGEPPVPGGDRLLAITTNGVIPMQPFLTGDPNAVEPGLQTDPQGAPGDAPGAAGADPNGKPGVGHNGSPKLDPDPHDDDVEAEPMEKAAGLTTAPGDWFQQVWIDFLAAEAPVISRMLVRSLPADMAMAMAKAAGDDPASDAGDAAAAVAADASGTGKAKPAAPSSAIEDAIKAAVDAADWPSIQSSSASALGEVAQKAAVAGVSQIQPMAAGIVIKSQGQTPEIDATKLPNPRAVAYAEKQAADLVSSVSDATRNMLRSSITQAQREGWSTQRLQAELQNSHAFSADRAQLIARNELKRSSTQGNIIGWQAMASRTGLNIKKRVILGPNENHCVVCRGSVLEGAIPLDDEFVAGSAPPFHPRCECTLVPVVGAASKPAAAPFAAMAKAAGDCGHDHSGETPIGVTSDG